MPPCPHCGKHISTGPYQRQRRAARVRAGRCQTCGRPKDPQVDTHADGLFYGRCLACRGDRNADKRAMRAARLETGLCETCGALKSPRVDATIGGALMRTCLRCRRARTARRRAKRQEAA